MLTKAVISEDEYLRTGYDNPEPDYIEGVLVERTMPDNDHSRVHSNIFRAPAR